MHVLLVRNLGIHLVTHQVIPQVELSCNQITTKKRKPTLSCNTSNCNLIPHHVLPHASHVNRHEPKLALCQVSVLPQLSGNQPQHPTIIELSVKLAISEGKPSIDLVNINFVLKELAITIRLKHVPVFVKLPNPTLRNFKPHLHQH